MEMDTIRVLVGMVERMTGGQVQDTRVPVEFQGEQLATTTAYAYDGDQLTDTRGVTNTLYRTADGRLIVHRKDWSRWQGEPTQESLIEITEADLSYNGEFEALGFEAGFNEPLTLDQAL
jgi:hypothetical protein